MRPSAGHLAREMPRRGGGRGLRPSLDDITVLQVRSATMHVAGADHRLALELGGQRSQKTIPLQRMNRPGRRQDSGVFVIGKRERHGRRESGPASAATMAPCALRLQGPTTR
jgi:hypothetical protein